MSGDAFWLSQWEGMCFCPLVATDSGGHPAVHRTALARSAGRPLASDGGVVWGRLDISLPVLPLVSSQPPPLCLGFLICVVGNIMAPTVAGST